MRPDNRAVDHHIFIVVICGQITKYPFDNAAFIPVVLNGKAAANCYDWRETGSIRLHLHRPSESSS